MEERSAVQIFGSNRVSQPLPGRIARAAQQPNRFLGTPQVSSSPVVQADQLLDFASAGEGRL
jgi:hypothetical protein